MTVLFTVEFLPSLQSVDQIGEALLAQGLVEHGGLVEEGDVLVHVAVGEADSVCCGSFFSLIFCVLAVLI